MASQIDFAPEEWALLRDLPFQAILGVIAADIRGPLGAAAKESVVAARALVAEGRDLADNTLISNLLMDYADGIETPDTEISLADGAARAEAMKQALDNSTAVAALLQSRTGELESSQYRQWVYDAAVAAANATRSGGFMGLGTKLVSEEEAAFLSRLSQALNLASA